MYTTRAHGARISTDYTFRGYKVAILENELIRVMLLVDRGGDVMEFRYKPLDIDVMWRSPWGLRPQNSWIPTTSPPGGNWMDHYLGGWQVIFPSGGGPSTYQGAQEGVHGEASLIAWQPEIIADTAEEVGLRLTVTTQRLPFKVVRELRLARQSGALRIQETIENLANVPLHCMWGQHPALGEPLVGPDLELVLPSCRVESGPGTLEAPDRIIPGSKGEWPFLPGPDGKPVDLRRLPPRDQPARAMLFATNLAEGWYAACNPKVGLGFGMSWPLESWPILWLWQELGGSMAAPWFGRTYTAALEPFSSRPDESGAGLAGAVANGTALPVGPAERRTVAYTAVAFPYGSASPGQVRRITPAGEVERTH